MGFLFSLLLPKTYWECRECPVVQWSNCQQSSSTQFNCVSTTINILSTSWPLPPVSVWFGPPTNLGPMWYQLELETAGSKASCNVIAAFLTRFVHFWPQMALILDTHDENVFLLFRFIAVFSLNIILSILIFFSRMRNQSLILKYIFFCTVKI